MMDWLYLGFITAIQLMLGKLIILCFMEEAPFHFNFLLQTIVIWRPNVFSVTYYYYCYYYFPKGTLIQPLNLKFSRDTPWGHVISLFFLNSTFPKKSLWNTWCLKVTHNNLPKTVPSEPPAGWGEGLYRAASSHVSPLQKLKECVWSYYTVFSGFQTSRDSSSLEQRKRERTNRAMKEKMSKRKAKQQGVKAVVNIFKCFDIRGMECHVPCPLVWIGHSDCW